MGIFSTIGHIINVAKVVANTASTILGSLPTTLNEESAMYCEEHDITFYGRAKYTLVHPSRRMVGKVTDISTDGGVDDDEVSFVLGISNGNNMIQATNNSDSPYFFTFNHTDAKGNLFAQTVAVQAGTSTDVTNNMKNFSLGNVVVTPARIRGSVTMPSSSSTPSTPNSPSVSRSGSIFSRKGRKSTDDLQALSLRDDPTPPSTQCTVLGSAGFATVIGGGLFYLYNAGGDFITIQWNADSSASSYMAMNSFTISNQTDYPITISATVSWTNPASTTTVDVLVAARSTGTGDLPVTEGPVSSACVAALTEDADGSIATKVTKTLLQQTQGKNLAFVQKSSVGQRGSRKNSNGVDVSSLSDKDRRALLTAAPLIATYGLDEAILSANVLRAAKLVGGTQQSVAKAVRQIRTYYHDDN